MSNEHKSDEDLSILVTKELHAPLFPYFGSVYMTLLSIIQGVILSSAVTGGLDVLISRGLTCSLSYLPVIVFAVSLWHKYVNHHQLLGWQLTVWDTTYVFLFCLPQALALATIKAICPPKLSDAAIKAICPPKLSDAAHVALYESIHNLTGAHLIDIIVFIMGIATLLGVIVYAHSGSRISAEYVRIFFVRHFGADRKLAKKLYLVSLGFEAKALVSVFWCGLAMIMISAFGCVCHSKICFPRLIDDYWDYLAAFLSSVCLGVSLAEVDLKRYLDASCCQEEARKIGEIILNNPKKKQLWWWVTAVQEIAPPIRIWRA